MQKIMIEKNMGLKERYFFFDFDYDTWLVIF